MNNLFLLSVSLAAERLDYCLPCNFLQRELDRYMHLLVDQTDELLSQIWVKTSQNFIFLQC